MLVEEGFCMELNFLEDWTVLRMLIIVAIVALFVAVVVVSNAVREVVRTLRARHAGRSMPERTPVDTLGANHA
jgi:hypothetical protein